MKRLIVRTVVRTAFVVLLLSAKSHAQSGGLVPQTDAGHAPEPGCVILKRMGRIDRTKSRLYSLGISGKQFRYVEGKLPEGFSLHRKMTDHDVRNLQARGAQVLVLDSQYSSQDLKEARANCTGQTGKTLTQAETKAPPAPAGGAVARNAVPSPMASPPIGLTPKVPGPDTPAPKTNDATSTPGTTVAALLEVSSTPTEADVYIDERLSGRTPATLILMPGDHKLVIKKSGFVVWKRKFNLASGRSNVDASLVPKAK